MKKNTLIYLLALALMTFFINAQATETGIQVHGHWKFDIYNADGSFDRSVDFENALTSNGSTSLIVLLGKNNTIKHWQIHIAGGVQQGPCRDETGLLDKCVIYEVGLPSQPHEFSNLIVSNNGTNTLTLKGSFTAATSTTSNLFITSLNISWSKFLTAHIQKNRFFNSLQC